MHTPGICFKRGLAPHLNACRGVKFTGMRSGLFPFLILLIYKIYRKINRFFDALFYLGAFDRA